MRRDVFLSLGGYNEAFRASDEELELGMRLHLAGVEYIFEPRKLLTHLNSKPLAGYFQRCWRASGSLDPYRVIELKQCNAQTRKIASRDHGYLSERIAARTVSSLSQPLLTSARLLEIAANRTHSKSLFSLWARTAHAAEYWEGVKQSGYTRHQLRDAGGAARNALMMHSICEPQKPAESAYYISPTRFHRFMKHFGEAGFRTATSAQWMERDFPSRSVLLTFDDAYDDLYTELFPLVIEHKYTPLIFVVVDHIGGWNAWDQAQGLRPRNLLSAGQLKEMQRYGVEFGSHTLTHPHLTGQGHRELVRELRDSKDRLEDLLGAEVRAFAYPYGAVDRRVRSYVAEAGYKLAFTTVAGANWWNDPLCQNRADVNDSMTLIDFVSVISTGWTVRQNIGDRVRRLEERLPGSMARATVRQMRRIARTVLPGESNT
jgi:peptidoglycan/xylan/chitin deacetylase (PgdA/CDA1 family)